MMTPCVFIHETAVQEFAILINMGAKVPFLQKNAEIFSVKSLN